MNGQKQGTKSVLDVSNVNRKGAPDSATIPRLNYLAEDNFYLSATFVDFLAKWLDKSGYENERWFDQRSEELSGHHSVMRRRGPLRLERLLSDETAQAAIVSVHRWFYNLATVRSDALEYLHKRYRFIAIVGAPRTGGSYLTGEAFSAVGYNPTAVPAAIAHDGFPEAQPITLSPGNNAWITSLLTTSEYLTLLDIFFPVSRNGQPQVVPKKLTKGVYAGSFFNSLLGESTEYVITIRHPISCCISAYEKSGGLPPGGMFKARSTIEKWIKRDLLSTGVSVSEIASMGYFEAFARFWEQYYINLAVSGLTKHRLRRVIPFGDSSMEAAARALHSCHGSVRKVSEFTIHGDLSRRHPLWTRRADEAMARVESIWQMVGLTFPSAELGNCL
jgi:hypothetical protein